MSLELRSGLITDAADVVLPVAAIAEKAGSFVDWEGRLGRSERSLDTAAMPDHRVLDMIAAQLGEFLGTRTIDEARQEMQSLGSWDGARAQAPAVGLGAAPAAPPAPAPGQVVLASWHHLLDAGLLQDGDPFLAGTAPISLARVSPQTAADFDLVDGAPVTVSTGHGAVTLPLEVTPMVDRVVWLPANSAGCRVRATLDAQPGDVVNLSKGGVA